MITTTLTTASRTTPATASRAATRAASALTRALAATATRLRIAAAGLAGMPVFYLEAIRQVFRSWENRRSLDVLAGLDDHMLRDIGLSRSDLRDAASEPLWRDPTAMLAARVLERRHHQRDALPVPEGIGDAPPLAPEIDAWSSRLFPARSRHY